MRNIRKYWNRPEKAAYLFLLPSLTILIIFSMIPLLISFGISLMNMNIFFKGTSFAGMSNYIRAFADDRFWNALKNTFVFVLLEVPLQIGLGLIVANALQSSRFFDKMARTIFFIPVVCSMAGVSIAWSILLDGVIGNIPYYLQQLGLPRMAFFRDEKLAMGTVVALSIWKNFGYTMSVLVVGIQGISKSYFEAAAIDGATKWKQFLYITLPGLAPTLGFCLITNMIGSLQAFDQFYLTTGGGPQYKTETIVMYIYNKGFKEPYELGYASAMSVVMFLIIFALSMLIYGKSFTAKED